MCSEEGHDCKGSHGLYSVHQSLDEMEFERGIWGAALDGDLHKLQKLLNRVDASTPDGLGYTALHYAARSGNVEVCKLLLKHNANVNAQTNGGATPIHRAALLGHSNIVSMLLLCKANIIICDSDGRTALHKAAEGQHLEVARILLNAKPELKAVQDKRGQVPYYYVKEKDSELAKVLT